MTDQLLAAIQSGSPTLIVGACILALVAFARLPGLAPQWQRIPSVYRPMVPAVVALLASIGEVLIGGRGWLAALVTGIVAGLPGVLLALPSPTNPPKELPLDKAIDRIVERAGEADEKKP